MRGEHGLYKLRSTQTCLEQGGQLTAALLLALRFRSALDVVCHYNSSPTITTPHSKTEPQLIANPR